MGVPGSQDRATEGKAWGWKVQEIKDQDCDLECQWIEIVCEETSFQEVHEG